MSPRRTFVVGDIHGCYDELIDLLQHVKFSDDDRMVAVGDLISKGPKNREVLDLFISDSRFSSVLGNQDLAVLNRLEGKDLHYTKAQKETAKVLEVDREKYIDFLKSLPLLIDLGSVIVVHAGIRPGVPLNLQAAADLLELRTLGTNPTKRRGTPWYEAYDGDKFVLFGHWPRSQPHRAPRALGIDTGCVYGHRLTTYLVETGELFSVAAREVYSHRPARVHNSAALIDQTVPPRMRTESIHA